jgi:hypothetical protein
MPLPNDPRPPNRPCLLKFLPSPNSTKLETKPLTHETVRNILDPDYCASDSHLKWNIHPHLTDKEMKAKDSKINKNS